MNTFINLGIVAALVALAVWLLVSGAKAWRDEPAILMVSRRADPRPPNTWRENRDGLVLLILLPFLPLAWLVVVLLLGLPELLMVLGAMALFSRL